MSKSGNVKPVDFTDTIEHIAGRVLLFRRDLTTLMSDNTEGIRDYAQQDKLLAEIQAGLRAIDVLQGACDLIGAGSPLKPTPGLPRVDMAELERQLKGGNGADKKPPQDVEGTEAAKGSETPKAPETPDTPETPTTLQPPGKTDPEADKLKPLAET